MNTFNFQDAADNYTCNTVLTKNNTIIEINQGWAGVPEAIIINSAVSAVSIFAGNISIYDPKILIFVKFF